MLRDTRKVSAAPRAHRIHPSPVHTPTLLIVMALQLGLLLAAAFPVLRTQGTSAFTRNAFFAVLLGATAVVLFGQRGAVPNLLSIVGGNAALLAAVQVWVHGLYRLCEVPRPTRKAEHLASVASLIAVCAFWALDASDGHVAFAKPRVIAAIVPMCVTGALWMRALYRASPAPLPLSRSYMLFASAMGLVLNITRGAVFALGPSGRDPMAAGATSYFLFFANVCVLFNALGTILEFERQSREALKSMNQQLALDAITDPLTGLGNRRALDHITDGVIRGARRQGWPVTVMLLDIDHFKRINDQWGHATGDAVLEEIAAICKARLRGHDVLLRWGGEEFALILPQCGLDAAPGVAERFLTDVRTAKLKATNGTPVTLSVGVALLETSEVDFADAISRADHAMYTAKRAGRDRFVMHEVVSGDPALTSST